MASYSFTVHSSSSHIFKLETSSLATKVKGSTLEVTLGSDTKLVNKNSSVPFNQHYKVFLVAKFTVGSDTQLVGAEKINKYSYVNSSGTRVYTDSLSSAPTSKLVYLYKYKAPYLIAELDAAYAQSDPYREWSSIDASKEKFEIPIPSGATSVLLYFYGDSDECYRYFQYAEESSASWHLSVHECPCKDHVAKNESSTSIYTNISAGAITSIKDNGDFTITVKGTKPSAGTNNNVTSSVLSVTFSGNGITSKTDTYTLINSSSGVSGGGNFEVDFEIPNGATLAEVSLTSEGQLGIGTSCWTSENITFGYPAPPTSLTYSTAKLNKPRLKDDLTWSWSGAAVGTRNGHNAKVAGYRVMIYKNNKNGGGTGAIELTSCTGHTNNDSNIPYVETTRNSLTFNPIEGVASTSPAVFEAKDRCYCRVYTYATWGSATHYSQESLLGIVDSEGTNQDINYLVNTDPENGLTECILHNSATIWIKTAKDTWTEGVPYVKTSDGWKEAEGVYIKTSDTEWSEAQ